MQGDVLLRHLDRCYEEGSSAQEDKRKKYEKYTDYYKGKIWPKGRPADKPSLVINNLKEIITRKVALMTDVTPQIEILPTDDTLTDAAKLIKQVIEVLFEQYSWADTHQEMIFFDQMYGSVFTNVCWDEEQHWGEGDLNILVGDPRTYIVDPFITRANRIYEAEYIIYEYFKSTSLLRHQYPDKDIKSHFDTGQSEKNTFLNTVLKTLKLKTETGFKPAIDRSLVKCYWIQDRDKDDTTKKILYPSGRFIKRVGNEILVDEANPYWDGRFPVDMMDWQFDPDSPFGISEVEDLASPYLAYNQLLSLIIENVILNVNSIWTGDIDAMPPGEREKLLRNKPGEFIGTRPGKKIIREAPPAIGEGAIGAAQYLRAVLDDISGLNEQSRGKRGAVTSGVAIESLALASQSIIRYQARRLESMLQRIGQKLIARIFQFYTDDRLFYLVGDSKELKKFKFVRSEILNPLIKIYQQDINKNRIPQSEINTYIAKKAFKNFRFHIIAGSSLAMTKVQRATLVMTLYKMGIVDDEAVLEMMEFPNRAEILRRKKEGKSTPKPTGKVKIPSLVSDKGLPKKGM